MKKVETEIIRCNKCGKIIKPIHGDQTFRIDNGYSFVISNLSDEVTYCDCGLNLDETTKKLLLDIGKATGWM